MSKEEILEYFKDINFMYNNPNVLDSLSRMLDEYFPEPKWIPCSERLPEKREMVIIWIDAPEQPFEQRSVHMAFAWREPDARTGELHWMDRHFSRFKDDKIIAWMPLPEPYREDNNEQNQSDH